MTRAGGLKRAIVDVLSANGSHVADPRCHSYSIRTAMRPATSSPSSLAITREGHVDPRRDAGRMSRAGRPLPLPRPPSPTSRQGPASPPRRERRFVRGRPRRQPSSRPARASERRAGAHGAHDLRLCSTTPEPVEECAVLHSGACADAARDQYHVQPRTVRQRVIRHRLWPLRARDRAGALCGRGNSANRPAAASMPHASRGPNTSRSSKPSKRRAPMVLCAAIADGSSTGSAAGYGNLERSCEA